MSRANAPATREERFFFAHGGARLFAAAHHAEPAADLGFVFCHPYGDEKQSSYPVLVRFARRLAAAGYPVLRFDCRGYGDSDGDLEDATVESHVEETLAAADLAPRQLGVGRVALLGVRFGAAVAALAGERRPQLAGLVLWDPVLAGARYAEEILRQRFFGKVLGQAGAGSPRQLRRELAETGHLDIGGNLLTRCMSEAIAAVDLPRQVGTFRRPVLVATLESRTGTYPRHETLAAAYTAAGSACALEVTGRRRYWEVGEMMKLYIPGELFERSEAWIRQRWPAS